MRFSRVLLVNPPSNAEWKGFRPHIGLGYIAEFLAANGVTYDVIDMNLGHSVKDLERKIEEFDPDLIGMTLLTMQFKLFYSILSQIKQALLNLVANAIEATPPGGAVVVEVRQAGEEVEIAVRDTGRGMGTETLARVGTPFFTTRPHGSGLGVVLARSVLTDHGGSLRYESAPGKGTTAVARLPGGSHEPPHAA